MSSIPFIKVKSMCLFTRGKDIFVSEMHDSFQNDAYYRPIGGTVEYGEPALVALHREIKEETGSEINSVEHLGTFENIFQNEGLLGHEIVYLFHARFSDTSLYDIDFTHITESSGEKIKTLWIPKIQFTGKTLRIVPSAILEGLNWERLGN